MSTSYALAVADDGCELDVLKAVSTILKPGDLVTLLCVTETRDGEKQSEGVSGSMTFMNKIGKLFMAMIHVKVSDRQCDVLVVGQGHSVEKGYPSLGGTCLFCLLHAPCHVLVARRCESS